MNKDKFDWQKNVSNQGNSIITNIGYFHLTLLVFLIVEIGRIKNLAKTFSLNSKLCLHLMLQVSGNMKLVTIYPVNIAPFHRYVG